jgi:ATP/maltotriose-dependent transcriptional regulator MalT
LGEAHLAFSGPEMQALARASGSELDDDAARMLVERTEGWVAPASLVLPALRWPDG